MPEDTQKLLDGLMRNLITLRNLHTRKEYKDFDGKGKLDTAIVQVIRLSAILAK